MKNYLIFRFFSVKNLIIFQYILASCQLTNLRQYGKFLDWMSSSSKKITNYLSFHISYHRKKKITKHQVLLLKIIKCLGWRTFCVLRNVNYFLTTKKIHIFVIGLICNQQKSKNSNIELTAS